FHLLRLADSFLGGDLVGEVANKAVEQEAAASPRRGHAELGPELLPVAPLHQELAPPSERAILAGAQKPAKRAVQLLTVRFDDGQVDHIFAERFLARPAVDLLGLRVPAADRAGLVHLDKGVERSLDDAARQPFAFA